ncbi:hypothetical protein MW887_005605 [Aspergillus wentii]|nr:hypothetical protein MW887_005605 [Aspergillus wentii]
MMGARLTDPHWAFLWEDPDPTTLITRATERVPWNLITDRQSRRHEKVVCVETGEVVGYARWTLPAFLAECEKTVWVEAQIGEPSLEEKSMYKEKFNSTTENGRWIGMKDSAMMDYRSAPLEEADARITQDGPFLTIDYLTTSPSFWRRGIGSMLVQSGLKIADAYNLKTYVMSEPAGLKVYLNHGFEVVDTVETDYSEFGGKEAMVHYFLVRESRA